MNQATQTEQTREAAIEAFNADMSNSICDGDRKQATAWLAKRIGDADKAETLRRDWMAQQRQAAREARQ